MPETNRPRLLFISATFPDTQGNGLAMRAGSVLEALAQRYDVSLLVVPCFGPRTASAAALIEAHCVDEWVVPPRVGHSWWSRLRGDDSETLPIVEAFVNATDAAAAAIGRGDFEVIHAFRLYTAPLAIALARRQRTPLTLELDLDDIESVTHRRLAQLHRGRGDAAGAEQEATEAAQYLKLERALLPRFDRVFVAADRDAARLAAVVRGDVLVLPNAVRPPEVVPEPRTTRPFTFLFVGTLGYYPNEDAARFFCDDVVPLIRAWAPRPFHVRIVGRGLGSRLAPLARIPEVRLVGRAPDLDLEYGEASAVVVPVRGGGGTRIKVLEAFAYQRPVVATSAGIEGIAAEPERHHLEGDSAEEFAYQCVALMHDADLGAWLAAEAAELVASRYSQTRINELIASETSPLPLR